MLLVLDILYLYSKRPANSKLLFRTALLLLTRAASLNYVRLQVLQTTEWSYSLQTILQFADEEWWSQSITDPRSAARRILALYYPS